MDYISMGVAFLSLLIAIAAIVVFSKFLKELAILRQWNSQNLELRDRQIGALQSEIRGLTDLINSTVGDRLSDVINILKDSRHIINDNLNVMMDTRHIVNENLKLGQENRVHELASQDLLVGTRGILNNCHETLKNTLNAIGTIDFGSRPTVRKYLEGLRHRSSSEPFDTGYSLDRNSRFIFPKLLNVGATKKFAVTSLALGERYISAIKPCIDSHLDYAREKEYSYVLLDQPPIYQARPPAWMKIPLIHNLLEQGYEYVFYVDADAMITNPSKRLDDFADAVMAADACIGLTEDEDGINSGVMIIRNSPETKALLNLIWGYDIDVRNGTWEQHALKYLCDNFEEVRERVLIEPNPRKFNSFPLERNLFFENVPKQTWSKGDFICHFSGIRQPHLQYFVNRYSKSLRSDRDAGKPDSAVHHAVVSRQPSGPSDGTVTFSKLGDWGQFGNQLFQISAVIGYARKFGSAIELPEWRCALTDQAYGEYFPAIEKFHSALTPAELYTEKNFSYQEIPYVPHIDLRGNFQCEKYFEHAKAEILELFAEPEHIAAQLDHFCETMKVSNFDAIHVRNYLHPDRDIGRGPMERLPKSYFVAAVQRIDDGTPLFVATDNRNYTTELLSRLQVRRQIIYMDKNDPLLDFYMLSRARRIAISNSSFSWWAAYLGRPKEQILAPHRYFWFSQSERRNRFWDPRDLYPDSFEEIIL